LLSHIEVVFAGLVDYADQFVGFGVSIRKACVELPNFERRTVARVAAAGCSRMLFFQINPTFQRFDCKVFLTDTMRYMNGARNA
jgi:hypothetical protein